MQNETLSIEKREIRGINARILWVIIASTACIIGFVARFQNQIGDKLNEVGHSVDLVKASVDNDRQLSNLRADMLQKQNDELRNRIELLENKIYKDGK